MKTTKQYGQKADLALGTWVKLARAYATLNRESVKDIRRYGLTQPQFGVIECLGHLGEMNIGELSKKMLVSGGNMTCVVDNLEKEGLVRRQHSESDRRAVIVALTEQGMTLFKEIFPQHAKVLTGLMAVLPESEQAELSRILKNLGQALAE